MGRLIAEDEHEPTESPEARAERERFAGQWAAYQLRMVRVKARREKRRTAKRELAAEAAQS